MFSCAFSMKALFTWLDGQRLLQPYFKMSYTATAARTLSAILAPKLNKICHPNVAFACFAKNIQTTSNISHRWRCLHETAKSFSILEFLFWNFFRSAGNIYQYQRSCSSGIDASKKASSLFIFQFLLIEGAVLYNNNFCHNSNADCTAKTTLV